MAQEKTFGDEARERCLFDRRGVLIHSTADLHKRIDQLLWRDDVAQAQRRTENLAHGACVNHSTGVVDPLQGTDRWSDETKLRVVIVFKNECVVSTRKIEQVGPTLQTHGNAERKLMGRRHINHSWQWFFWRACDYHSLVVERFGHDLNACQTKNSSGLLITRVFDPCGLTRI